MNVRRKTLFFIIIFLVSLYMFIFKIPFPWTDDLFYKQAGVNFFRGLGFSVTGVKGLVRGIEVVYLQYPPIYPFSFGIWFFLFGFSLSASLILSFLICGLSTVILVLLFESVADTKKLPFYIYALIFFSWNISIQAIHRPDPLLTLLGLSLLLLIIKKASTILSFKTQLYIILLMALSLGTSPGLGVLLMIYMFFALISIKGSNRQIIKTYSTWCFLGGILTAIIWWISAHRAPELFEAQFIHTLRINLAASLKNLQEGLKFNFEHGYTWFHVPLIGFLASIFVVSVFLEKDKSKRSFLVWQFFGVATVWTIILLRIPTRYTYQQAFFAFFIFTCGTALIRLVTNIRNSYLKGTIVVMLYLLILLPCLLFFRTLALPLTWNEKDTYGYNKNLILANIPKGSKVLTAVRFWYIFDKDYEIFDSYFGELNIYDCDYVLLASGGSGKPEIAPLDLLHKETEKYFYDNFKKKFSTMSDQPNRLLGFNISKSRWCYRFELYERTSKP